MKPSPKIRSLLDWSQPSTALLLDRRATPALCPTLKFDTYPSQVALFQLCLMVQAVGLNSIGFLNYALSPKTKISYGQPRTLVSPSTFRLHPIRAVQDNEGPRRLVDIIRLVPELSRNYFRKPSRRALFGGIALLGGFYVAQTISLSFGALGVNDVIAAVLCVLVTEYVTKFYYSRPKVTFPVALLNNFKMGFTYGLFIDAFKLASWFWAADTSKF